LIQKNTLDLIECIFVRGVKYMIEVTKGLSFTSTMKASILKMKLRECIHICRDNGANHI